MRQVPISRRFGELPERLELFGEGLVCGVGRDGFGEEAGVEGKGIDPSVWIVMLIDYFCVL
jgi:hypothetical protein